MLEQLQFKTNWDSDCHWNRYRKDIQENENLKGSKNVLITKHLQLKHKFNN